MKFGNRAIAPAKADTVTVEIRHFNNRFAWKWSKFTEDRGVIVQILQNTRENLGYSGSSRFPEVQFENLDGSGEWYLDTQGFQSMQGLSSAEANNRLTDAFIDACRDVGDQEGFTFSFVIIDMLRKGEIIEEVND